MNDFKKIKDVFTQRDKYLVHNNIEIIKIGLGTSKLRMPISDFHLNGMKVVHGGAIFTLCDLGLSVASNSYGKGCVSNNISINFIKPGRGEYLVAKTKEISRGKKIAVYSCNLYNDMDVLVAQAVGNFYILDRELIDIIEA